MFVKTPLVLHGVKCGRQHRELTLPELQKSFDDNLIQTLD